MISSEGMDITKISDEALVKEFERRWPPNPGGFNPAPVFMIGHSHFIGSTVELLVFAEDGQILLIERDHKPTHM